jgi:uncharacterized membrane protein
MLDKFNNLNLFIPSEILWGLLAFMLLFFLITGFILNYHWKYYGIKDNPKVFAKSIFWIISIILIIIMTISLLSYENSLTNIL